MGVEPVAREHDLAVVLSEMQGRRTPGRSWIEGVLARRPTGIIAVLSDLSEGQRALLKSRGVPLVVVDPTGEPLHDTPSIGATNWSGGLAATRHLLGLGHRRIGVISGPENVLCSRARLDGYRAAMDEAGVPIDPGLIRYGNFHVQDGDHGGPRAPPPARSADGDLRRQRPPGARRLPGRPRGAPAHPRGPQRGRLRRPAGRHLGRPAADDGPPAARPDGHGRPPGSSCAWPTASIRRRRASSSPPSSSSGRARRRRIDEPARCPARRTAAWSNPAVTAPRDDEDVVVPLRLQPVVDRPQGWRGRSGSVIAVGLVGFVVVALVLGTAFDDGRPRAPRRSPSPPCPRAAPRRGRPPGRRPTGAAGDPAAGREVLGGQIPTERRLVYANGARDPRSRARAS